jgi:hypothetical protein
MLVQATLLERDRQAEKFTPTVDGQGSCVEMACMAKNSGEICAAAALTATRKMRKVTAIQLFTANTPNWGIQTYTRGRKGAEISPQLRCEKSLPLKRRKQFDEKERMLPLT